MQITIRDVDSLTLRLAELPKEVSAGITTAKKQKIITSLIERIEVFPDKLEIGFALGALKTKRELVFASSLLNSSEESFFPAIKWCSASLTNGGPGENRTPTPLRILDFESSASTNSTTGPCFEVHNL